MATIARMAARPAKPKNQLMMNPLPIRFTQIQRELIDKASASCSLETSSWVRMVAVEAAKKRLAEIALDD